MILNLYLGTKFGLICDKKLVFLYYITMIIFLYYITMIHQILISHIKWQLTLHTRKFGWRNVLSFKYVYFILGLPGQRQCELLPWLDVHRRVIFHIFYHFAKLFNQIEPKLAVRVLGKRRFRLIQMKLILPGEGLKGGN